MYRSRRRRSVHRGSSGFHAAAPLVAFLLIASFGILFAGCSTAIKGPDAGQMQDDTFTAEDVATFHDLAKNKGTTMGSGGTVSTGTGRAASALPRLDIAAAGSGAASAAAVPLDPELARRYAALRAGSATGTNSFRVINEFLNARATPDTRGVFVEKLNQGDMVSLVSFADASWAKIQMADGKQGYVASRYIAEVVSDDALAREKKTYEGMYYVNYKFVNVRKAADAKSEKIGQMLSQAIVKPVGVDKDWAKVTVDGKEGFASMQFLAPFHPQFIVRQDRFAAPILHYHADQPGVADQIVTHVQALRQAGVKIITMRTLFDTLLLQEGKDAHLPPKSMILTISGITPDNVRKVSDLLYGNGIPATLFLETRFVGLSAINERTLLTLQADGFDIESAGHTGDDLRGLTNSQVMLELQQSRGLLEDMTKKTVFAVAYPQGGVNDRVMQKAQEAGYLFGMGEIPDKSFSRDQFLRLPSITVTSSMTPQDLLTFLP